jgi:hypothetical protein
LVLPSCNFQIFQARGQLSNLFYPGSFNLTFEQNEINREFTIGTIAFTNTKIGFRKASIFLTKQLKISADSKIMNPHILIMDLEFLNILN